MTCVYISFCVKEDGFQESLFIHIGDTCKVTICFFINPTKHTLSECNEKITQWIHITMYNITIQEIVFFRKICILVKYNTVYASKNKPPYNSKYAVIQVTCSLKNYQQTTIFSL